MRTTKKKSYMKMYRNLAMAAMIGFVCQNVDVVYANPQETSYERVSSFSERKNGIKNAWQESKYFGVRPFKAGDDMIVVKTQPHYIVDFYIDKEYQYNYTAGDLIRNTDGTYETIGKKKVITRADYKGIAVLKIERVMEENEERLKTEKRLLENGNEVKIVVSGDDGFYLDSVTAQVTNEVQEKDSDLYNDPNWDKEIGEYDPESDEDYYFEHILGQDPNLRGMTEKWEKSRYFGVAPIKENDKEIYVKSVPYARVFVTIQKEKIREEKDNTSNKKESKDGIDIDARANGAGIARMILKDAMRGYLGFGNEDDRIIDAGDVINITVSGDDGFYLDSMRGFRVKSQAEVEEERRKEEQRILEEQKKQEEQRRLEEEKRQEEQRRLEEEKRQEEQRRLEEEKRQEEQKRLEEEKRQEEQRRLEEEKKQEEQKRLEEQKKLEDRRRKQQKSDEISQKADKGSDKMEKRKKSGERKVEDKKEVGGVKKEKEEKDGVGTSKEKTEKELSKEVEKTVEDEQNKVTISLTKQDEKGDKVEIKPLKISAKKVILNGKVIKDKKFRKHLKNKKLISKKVLKLNIKKDKNQGNQLEGYEVLVSVNTDLKKLPKKIFVMNLESGKLMKARHEKKSGNVIFKTKKLGQFVLVMKRK